MYLKINQIIISNSTLIKSFFNCIIVVRVFNYISINFADVTIHVFSINKLLLHFNITMFEQCNIKVGLEWSSGLRRWFRRVRRRFVSRPRAAILFG